LGLSFRDVIKINPMSSVIFYFSGTGNSYVVAKEIAINIDSKMIAIKNIVNNDEILVNEQIIGIIFPAYYMTMPRIVERFISKLQGIAGKYIFSVITVAGIAGNINKKIGQAIKKSGGELSSSFIVKMPANYIDSSDALPVYLQNIILSRSKKKMCKIATKIKMRKTGYFEKINPIGTLIFATMIAKNRALEFDIPNIDSYFWTDDRCTLCGTCQKICPVGNIIISNQSVRWKGNCEKCFSCIQWCSEASIQFSNKTLKRKRYHHPDVTLAEIIK